MVKTRSLCPQPLCKIVWKSNKNCGRRSDDRHTDRQTDRRKYFIICPMLCYVPCYAIAMGQITMFRFIWDCRIFCNDTASFTACVIGLWKLHAASNTVGSSEHSLICAKVINGINNDKNLLQQFPSSQKFSLGKQPCLEWICVESRPLNQKLGNSSSASSNSIYNSTTYIST